MKPHALNRRVLRDSRFCFSNGAILPDSVRQRRDFLYPVKHHNGMVTKQLRPLALQAGKCRLWGKIKYFFNPVSTYQPYFFTALPLARTCLQTHRSYTSNADRPSGRSVLKKFQSSISPLRVRLKNRKGGRAKRINRGSPIMPKVWCAHFIFVTALPRPSPKKILPAAQAAQNRFRAAYCNGVR
ncbi:hypothetical protein [Neisseria musculi]|uniref:Uncharacterized protein n=1 Tax=Neisseria musculi TaxID=1815583 RepID=A0A7H1M7U1_9NEIS|nr:hypothetical protein H7A79_2334 [Neisseria musculi]